MTIGQRIKYKRIECNLSQEELAKRVNTTKQTIYKYEMGIITNIPSDRIEAMANVFGVSPAYIMGWEELSSNTTAPTPELTLTEDEKQLIQAYRSHPEMQGVVRKILDVPVATPTVKQDIIEELKQVPAPVHINTK